MPELSLKENKTEDQVIENIEAGEWVAAIYNDIWYPGLVTKTDSDKITIKYMNRSGQFFLWPTKPDVDVINKNGILCKLQSPEKITSRLFKFSNVSFVEKLMLNF